MAGPAERIKLLSNMSFHIWARGVLWHGESHKYDVHTLYIHIYTHTHLSPQQLQSLFFKAC